MRRALLCACLLLGTLGLNIGVAHADDYSRTIAAFRHAGASAKFFRTAYGYAVFPTIGKGGFYIGAAHGDGRVYEHGRFIGRTSMTQVSIGFQIGGQAYSEILFFENRAALEQFETGNFALSADASAVAITAGVAASAGTTGNSASANAGEHAATSVGTYQNGVAVFTIAKGGLMYEAAVAGQKFSFSRR